MSHKPSVLHVLLLVLRCPEMYFGHHGSRGKQLDALAAMLVGYTLCLHQHRLPNEELVTIGELEDFLRASTSCSGSPIPAIRAAAASDEEAWARVGDLIATFASTRGVEL